MQDGHKFKTTPSGVGEAILNSSRFLQRQCPPHGTIAMIAIVKLSLCLIYEYFMKMYGGVDV
jgi:hypothetical protein